VGLICLLAISGAALSLVFTWRQEARPGMRRYLSGMERLAARQPKAAEAEWLQGIQEDPKERRCWEQLGDYYTTLRQFDRAADCYATAVRLAPRDASLHARLATAERRRGRREPARLAAARAARLAPNDAEVVGAYGILLAESRDRPAALLMLRRAHALRPADSRYLLALANTEMDSLEFAAAERRLGPYLKAHPKDADARYMMAVIQNQKPRTPENLAVALEHARLALAGMPGDPRACALVGQLYLDAGRTGDALRVYEAGRRLAPDGVGILRGLAVCYGRLGQAKEQAAVARRLEQVLARRDRIAHLTSRMGYNHQDTVSGLELARLVERDGRLTQARAYYEQLVRQAPGDARVRSALAGFYQRMGWRQKAERAREPSFVP
jgi:cytochrome c-type biogenesis protein CcmH/NrfG